MFYNTTQFSEVCIVPVSDGAEEVYYVMLSTDIKLSVTETYEIFLCKSPTLVSMIVYRKYLYYSS